MIIDLTVPQTQFTMAEDVKYPLFVAGFGSGKTTCLVVNALRDLQDYPGANIGIYAPTYDLIGLIIVPYLEEVFSEAEIEYSHNKSNHIIEPEGFGKIIMRSMDNPARIVGYQVFRSHIDELDTVGAKNAEHSWNKIIARNRQKIYIKDADGHKIKGDIVNGKQTYKTFLNRVSAYTTPEGFAFCYNRWEKKKADGYKLFRASTYSNAHNLPEDYIQTLKDTYPPALFDAYVHGYFVNLTSGSCYPQFDRKLNHSDEIAKPGEELHVGMDFNVMRGSATINVIRNDDPIQVDEISNAYDTDEQIRYLQENYANHYINVYPDASGIKRTSSNTVETDIAKLEAAGFNVIRDYSNPAIKDRVFSFQAMICNKNGLRRFKINTEKCPNSTECYEQQVWGDNGLPDKKEGKDHLPDAQGYFIWQVYPLIKPAAGVTVVGGRY